MPLRIINNHVEVSLNELVSLMKQGYSVVKSPHVGNQHPSNLVCAKLGIPLSMVTFTQGERDTNFHPHLKIAGGKATEISDRHSWTPFARMACGMSVETFHQSELKARFPNTLIRTDAEVIESAAELAEATLRTITGAIPDAWYRQVDSEGVVTKVTGQTNMSWGQMEENVYRFSNPESGWVIPNRAHIVFELALQCLSSGRDTIYHLAGPQMNGYIGKIQKSLSKAYDALRIEWPDLPEVLTAYIVPVAACRMVSHKNQSTAVTELNAVLEWYESLTNEEKRHSNGRLSEIVTEYPEFLTPIEEARCLSQYDLSDQDDLLLSDWMLTHQVGRVTNMYNRLCRLAA